MTPEAFIATVAADLKRTDQQIKKLQRKRRFAAHLIDAAETFKRNNSPVTHFTIDPESLDRLRQAQRGLDELREELIRIMMDKAIAAEDALYGNAKATT